jgi:glyoxylase-like metal-dependent hydrolase (beta-lactamase superfamily II)
MIHLVFPVGPLGCNCSIIGDETSHEAMVIDPGDEVDAILARLARHSLVLKHIVVTHCHVDHIGGANKLKAATGAPILLNKQDHGLLKLVDAQASWLGMEPPGAIIVDAGLNHGDKVVVGNIEGQVLHTPGHSEGSVCLYFESQKKLIAGDTLFAGGIGRTDLPGGDFDKIMASLHTSVLTLPDEVEVVPGHGPLTTIAAERESNPFLQK